ncbi:MAG: LytTR family DNA-binding domain-containing protein [Acidobacteria bacterium]|nr:LytTR family DNA-binding domain-containing protein [Acidobacteriota bacterium]
MRILIADDEAPARRKLRRYLPQDEILEAGGGWEAVRMIETAKPDLVLLDIQMPDLTGLEVLEKVQHRPAVIFVTAYDEHAISAFEAQALDYLLKPVAERRLIRAIERVKRLTRKYPRHLENEGKLIPLADVSWAEAARNYVVLHAGETHIVRSSLDAIVGKLDPDQFTRISRSHVINLSFVEAIEPLAHGERRVRLRDGTELTWTRRYRNGRE